ncbi:MAG: NAD(P)H-hydrate dehydratase [Chloroflexi bacterium]|nr:NAD(P)H-hydrate dehydratase [Chloroflexota bacterium]
MKIVTREQMNDIDRKAAQMGLPTAVLMENAGRAVACEVTRVVTQIEGKVVLVLVGTGNNGGDGLVAARVLKEMGARPSAYMYGRRDAEKDAAFAAAVRSVPIIKAEDDPQRAALRDALKAADIVIDALLGTGKPRPLDSTYKGMLQSVTEAKSRRPSILVVGLDLPSGLDANTGAVDVDNLFCDVTVTLGYPKAGLFQFPGADRVGRLIITDIGLPQELAAGINLEMISSDWARSRLPERPLNSNKGTFGRVLVVSGSVNYIGAAYLACMGAYRVGAGLVTLATPASIQFPVAARMAEATYLPLAESAEGVVAENAVTALMHDIGASQAILVGPGLGSSQASRGFIKGIVLDAQSDQIPALVLDADGLNAMDDVEGWWQRLPRHTILTPHPGELSRLTKTPVAEIQANRVDMVRRLAQEWGQTVLLKGAYTVIGSADGQVKLNPIANPGMATAGTGDVLAGVIAGLLAQGVSPFDAACLGAYLHGMAGDMVSRELGSAGMIAGDLLPELPKVIKRLKETGPMQA